MSVASWYWDADSDRWPYLCFLTSFQSITLGCIVNGLKTGQGVKRGLRFIPGSSNTLLWPLISQFLCLLISPSFWASGILSAIPNRKSFLLSKMEKSFHSCLKLLLLWGLCHLALSLSILPPNLSSTILLINPLHSLHLGHSLSSPHPCILNHFTIHTDDSLNTTASQLLVILSFTDLHLCCTLATHAQRPSCHLKQLQH